MTSLTNPSIYKIVAFILLLYLARATAGSCLSYGHSCWGGHGKRSTFLRHLINPSSMNNARDDWYFSNLLRTSNEKAVELPLSYNNLKRNSKNLRKLNQIRHQRNSLSELADLQAGSHHVQADYDSGEQIPTESNESYSETVFQPEDLIWNTNLPIYQKPGCP